jgi:hypothetical protein
MWIILVFGPQDTGGQAAGKSVNIHQRGAASTEKTVGKPYPLAVVMYYLSGSLLVTIFPHSPHRGRVQIMTGGSAQYAVLKKTCLSTTSFPDQRAVPSLRQMIFNFFVESAISKNMIELNQW